MGKKSQLIRKIKFGVLTSRPGRSYNGELSLCDLPLCHRGGGDRRMIKWPWANGAVESPVVVDYPGLTMTIGEA